MSSQGHSDDAEQRRARKRQKKQQQQEDLRILQTQVREAQEAERRAREENEALRQQLDGRQAQGLGDDRVDGAPELSKSEMKSWKKAATVAGRRVAALHAPFLDADCLADHQVQGKFDTILEQVKMAKDSDDELEDADNPAMYWDTPRFGIPDPVDLVREMIFHLPKSPGKFWLDEWFQDAVKLGIRKQRGDIVHAVAKRYEKIFDIMNPDFEDRSKRPDLPEVQALMESFMHIGEETEDGELDLSMFFRDTCIVRVIRLLLNGPSAIRTGRRSSKSRRPHAQMWHIRVVTPSLIAFATTVIKFVLSGEPSFEENSRTNYTDWFLARLQILEGVHRHYPEAFKELMEYYNCSVLPDLYPEDGHDADSGDDGNNGGNNMAGLSMQDKAFLARLGGGN